MYSIQNVIYGVPLTEEVNEWLDGREPEEFGFETLYSGGADFSPGFCGVWVIWMNVQIM